jgi:hypothetical protein
LEELPAIAIANGLPLAPDRALWLSKIPNVKIAIRQEMDSFLILLMMLTPVAESLFLSLVDRENSLLEKISPALNRFTN